MNITRNNYEEFFMLYADNELSAAEKKEVEAFIAANPDMRDELALFQQFKLKPDAAVVFDDKASLLKEHEAQLSITLANYESFFVLYADNELSGAEKTAVENFVYRNPLLQPGFELLQQAKFSADTNIVFENKAVLLRKEKDDRVIPFPWWRMAAAAAVILFVTGFFWINSGKKVMQPELVQTKIKPNIAPVKQPVLRMPEKPSTDQVNKNETPPEKNIVAVNTVKKNSGTKNTKTTDATTALTRKQTINNTAQTPERQSLKSISPEKEDIARLPENRNTGAAEINETPKKVEPQKTLVAAADKVMPDQPSIFLHPDENENTKVSYVSSDNDKVEVLNTSVNTKSSLRGFLRKASRLIAKKTDAGNENDERKRILIGGFAIAVR